MNENIKTEFWNSILTEKSWNLLQELKKKHKFILIGGWAIYLLTKQLKSKDIDIIVNIEELYKFDSQKLTKNDKLRKYEVKEQEVDIDIYLEHYSKLVVPVEDIKNYVMNVQGFQIACPEVLLILKHAAYKNRRDSVKGGKDLIDVISLVLFSNLDFKKYLGILDNYKLGDYLSELKKLVKNFKEYDKIGLNPREFKIKKNKLLIELAKLT